MEKEQKKQNLFDVIKDNWQVTMVIVSIIFSWAYFQFNLNSLVARVNAVEMKANTIDSVSGDIKAINAKLDIIIKKVQL